MCILVYKKVPELLFLAKHWPIFSAFCGKFAKKHYCIGLLYVAALHAQTDNVKQTDFIIINDLE